MGQKLFQMKSKNKTKQTKKPSTIRIASCKVSLLPLLLLLSILYPVAKVVTEEHQVDSDTLAPIPPVVPIPLSMAFHDLAPVLGLPLLHLTHSI